MILYNSLTEALDNRNPEICYCELIISETDLMIQAALPYRVDDLYTVQITALSIDGNTILGNVTSFFQWFTGIDAYGNYYFSAMMVSFPPPLCGKCFILRIEIMKGNVWALNAYTDIYCIGNCCSLPDDITVTGTEGIIPVTTDDKVTTATEIENKCQYPILRIEAIFQCNDEFGYNFYGDPAEITGGNSPGFRFHTIINIAGIIRRIGRTITKEISINCRTQKTSSIRNWELQGFEIFPEWKMDEIENMFCAPELYINGKKYLFIGGETLFTLFHPRKCNSGYKLRGTLQDCTTWQIFGCDERCKPDDPMYYGLMRQSDRYYSDNGQLIAYTYDELLQWFAIQNGVTNVEDVDPGEIQPGVRETLPSYYKIFMVEGKGPIPSYFYQDSVNFSNRIYGHRLNPDDPDYRSLFTISNCNIPQIGVITFSNVVCGMPLLGEATFADTMNISDVVHSFEQWIVQDGSSVSRTDEQVTLNFTSVNSTLVTEAGENYLSDIIGYVREDYIPTEERHITSENNTSLPPDTAITIGTDGTIRYSGKLPITESGQIYSITVSNIIYII